MDVEQLRRNEFLIWNRPMETMDREKLAKLQGERLHKTIQRVYKKRAHVPPAHAGKRP